MTKYTIVLDLDEGVNSMEQPRTPDQVVRYLQLSLQQALTKANVLVHKSEVREGGARQGGGGKAGGNGTPGRKPTNRPKVEQWIRDNITAGPSTQGTVGLEGVDRNGFPKDLPNRIFIHRMAMPVENGGCGVSELGIKKVLGELEREGYLERGFAAGAPFYELIRELEAPGLVGVRGRPLDEPVGATPHEVDFEGVED